LALATTCTGEAGCMGCRVTETLEGVVFCRSEFEFTPAEPQPSAAPTATNSKQIPAKRMCAPERLKMG
jgi:hypothetical protein